MSRTAWLTLLALLIVPAGCADDGSGGDELGLDSLGDSDTTGDGDGDGDPTGDGDGDPTGDGDGDPTGDGDGDPTGDGDGDPTGDGDGDPTGDGDGDPTGDGDGDPGACPSGGAGGVAGQAEISTAMYPNTPGIIHVPQTYDPNQPMPVMLALHGSGDTASNFVNLWSGIADAEGFIVLVPESLSGGMSWNPGTDTQVISALLDEVEASWNVDTCRVYLTGYSAGAHYGYMLGLANATYFAAMGIQAGSMSYAVQAGIWPNMVMRQIAVDIHHGINDPGVPLSEAEYARDQLEGAGHTVYFHTHDGGHEIAPGNPQEMWDDISMHTVMD
jgi:predicted esterase